MGKFYPIKKKFYTDNIRASVTNCMSDLPKASSSTVSSALPAITKNPSQPQLPPWLLQPQLHPWPPQSWSLAAGATCCRAASGTAARCTLSPSWSPSGTWARDLPRGAGLHQSATKLAAALQDTPQQSYSREEKEDLKIV